MATATSPQKRSSNKNGSATQKDLPVGKNATVYLAEKNYGVRQKAKILKQASEMARTRGSRVIRVEFVMVADGSITQRQLGTKEVERIRRALARKRTTPSKASGSKTSPPKPRQQRRKATQTKNNGSGKKSGSGRAAGKRAAKK
jgi:hypothetical protein